MELNIFRKINFVKIALLGIVVSFFGIGVSPADASVFNRNNLISDSEFLALDSMTVAEIQAFLESYNSALATFSEGGRSASQIIYDTAQGKNLGEAEKTWSGGFDINESTGTVSPKVILTTLAKEQGLIFKTIETARQIDYDWAMGYGVCDDCSIDDPEIQAYKGFAKQVAWGSAQLRVNFMRSVSSGSWALYRAGNSYSVTVEGPGGQIVVVTMANHATASLYAYTPHVGVSPGSSGYGGNYSFWNLYFNTFNFTAQPFSSQLVAQLASSQSSTYIKASVGEKIPLSITLKNNGTSTWTSSGACQVGIALDDSYQLAAVEEMAKFGYKWPSGLIDKISGSVVPSETAEFKFHIKIPWLPEGRYYLAFKPQPGNCGNFSGLPAIWSIDIINPDAVPVSNPKLSSVTPGEIYELSATYKNTSNVAWSPTAYPVTLELNPNFSGETLGAMKRYRYDWLNSTQIVSVDKVVEPGENYTFKFLIRIPRDTQAGVYQFNVRPTQKGYKLISGKRDTTWQIVVGEYQAQKVSASPNVSIMPGETAKMSVTLKNTGTTTWHKNASLSAPVRLAVDPDVYPDRSKNFIDSSWISAMQIAPLPHDVKPKEKVTIDFEIKAKPNLAPGRYYLYTRPIANGYSYFDSSSYAHWRVNVLEPTIALTDQSSDIVNAEPGEIYSLTATYRNTTGSTLDPKDTQLRIALEGNSSELASMRRFNPKNWISTYTIVGIDKPVKSGESYTFNIPVRVPWNSLPGQYSIKVKPVLNGYKDFGHSQSASWTISVAKPNAKLISQSSHFSAQKGGTYDLAVTLRNNGVTTWQQNSNAFQLQLTDELGGSLAKLDEMQRLGRAAGTWISKDRVVGLDRNVSPGESYTFNFQARIPWSINYDKLRLSLKPTQNNYLPFPVERGGVSWIISIVN